VIEVIPIKTHPLFEQSAVEALRRWKYRPAMQGGRAVKVYLLVTVEFRLIG
jgi:outer membrane biosynthesis protein TonB